MGDPEEGNEKKIFDALRAPGRTRKSRVKESRVEGERARE
jgi:hypothetical protein